MAFERDEMEKRRQQRKQRAQQRQAERKKLLTRLIVAAAVLVACAVLILVITMNTDSNDTQKQNPQQTGTSTETQQQEGTEQTQESTQPKKEGTTVIHFGAVGDLNITDNVVAAGGELFDYTDAFCDVVPLLAQTDLTVVNLEGSFAGSPYGSQTASAPQQLITALANIGVDMIQVANSYAMNKGVSGLISTLQSIRAAGLTPVGAFVNGQEFNKTGGYNIFYAGGLRIAVVAFTKGMDNMALPAGSEKCVNLLYSDYSSNYHDINTQGITKILRNIKKDDPDVTIALLHWGSEYNDTHSETQKKIRDLMLKEGVDAIIGTHPHYVQEIEFNEQAGTLVAYSLGDFFGDGKRSGTEYSIFLDLEITKDNKTGETKITGYSYTPMFIVSDEQTLRVVRLEQTMAAYEQDHIEKVSRSTYESMKYAQERVALRVNPKKEE